MRSSEFCRALMPIRGQAERRVRRHSYAIRTRMPQAKRLLVTIWALPAGHLMAITSSEGRSVDSPRNYPPRAAVISWIFFDWAAQPYFTLITTFVFAPYFASFVAPNPATGQALWGFATAAAGLMWIGKPGDPSIIPPLLLAYAIASVGVEFATVFNNAMMPTLVPPDKIG